MNNPLRPRNTNQRKRPASSGDLLFILEEGMPFSLNYNTYSLVPDVLSLVFVSCSSEILVKFRRRRNSKYLSRTWRVI